jgi:hypothetical protein
MRLCRRTQQRLFYSVQESVVPVYETNIDGNIVYDEIDGEQVPVETGSTEIRYSVPKEIFATVSVSGGEAEAKPYGMDTSSYDATIILPTGLVNIPEGSVLWRNSEIEYKDEDCTIIDAMSADYIVVKVSESQNYTRYVLKARTK